MHFVYSTVMSTKYNSRASLHDFYIRDSGQVTADDVRSVASSMLRAKPAMAALGSLAKLPSLSDIEAALLNPGRAPGRRRYSLF